MFKLIAFLFKAAIWIGVIALIVGGVLRVFFVDVAVVGHEGMAPTLVAGDYVAVWRNAEANLGDVVICQHPGDTDRHVMGRVIAKAGYTVETDHFGQVTVGGNPIRRDYRGVRTFYDSVQDETFTMKYGIAKFGYYENEFFIETDTRISLTPTKIEKGVYLLGDNYSAPGNDSRAYGEVDPDTCIGEIFMRLWPAEDRGDDIRNHALDIIQ